MTDVLTEVVQATRDEHDTVSKACFRIPKAVFDDPYPLDSRQDMLHCHPKLPHQTTDMLLYMIWISVFTSTCAYLKYRCIRLAVLHNPFREYDQWI